MGDIYNFANGMPAPQLMLRPAEPIPLNPNYRRTIVPAKVIIDTMMRDRSSFIADLTKEPEQGDT